ncbi:MAG: helix-turn-helix transcriptional regulator [Chthoniobacterales bacterium]|nr:helix-turn-helix transcriptional regulator [Chthoniobacterales bacterium]
MTQAKVSELARLHTRYYQDVEACRKTPSVAIAARLQRALKCDWTDLTKGL